jgi:hypothetical protein
MKRLGKHFGSGSEGVRNLSTSIWLNRLPRKIGLFAERPACMAKRGWKPLPDYITQGRNGPIYLK